LKKRYLELVALFGSCAGLLAFTSLVFLATASPAQAACGSLPSSLGTATLSVSVPSNGNYRVWVRELAPSTSTGGFYLQMADAGDCQITMGNAQVVANTWTWVDYQNANTGSPVNVTLTSGSHQVILAALNSGLELDKIELLSDTSCTPTGDGTNSVIEPNLANPHANRHSGINRRWREWWQWWVYSHRLRSNKYCSNQLALRCNECPISSRWKASSIR
jgi:hypothetical protein